MRDWWASRSSSPFDLAVSLYALAGQGERPARETLARGHLVPVDLSCTRSPSGYPGSLNLDADRHEDVRKWMRPARPHAIQSPAPIPLTRDRRNGRSFEPIRMRGADNRPTAPLGGTVATSLDRHVHPHRQSIPPSLPLHAVIGSSSAQQSATRVASPVSPCRCGVWQTHWRPLPGKQ